MTQLSELVRENPLLTVGTLLLLAWSWPLAQIVRAWHGTSLAHTAWWLVVAWFGWLVLPWAGLMTGGFAPCVYLALLLAVCALVAALGARLPGMAAWNFVVVGLLVSLALPLLEQPWRSPAWRLDEPRSLFLGLILFVGLLDYLPTRHGVSALILFAGAAWLAWELFQANIANFRSDILGWWLLVCVTALWLGWWRGHGAGPFQTADTLWFCFRDRYGAVWALRVMEQMNQVAKHADWNLRLTWFGFAPFAGEGQAPPPTASLEKLRQVLQKFIPQP